MKTKKLYSIAALALMISILSSGSINSAYAATIDGRNKILSQWSGGEHIAVLYEVGGTMKVADATITAVDDDDDSATIEFTAEAGTPDNTPCTLVYPYSAAKDDYSGVKDAATLLAAQDGTLSANLDVRVGAGTIQTSTSSLDVTTQPAAQFAIFKFTTKSSDGSADIEVTSLTVTTGGQDYVITPGSATSELYVALPAVSGQAVSFTATGSDGKTYTCSKPSVTFSAGKYYQSNIKLKEQAPALNLTSPAVGQVIGDDGKNYDYASLPGGVTAVAKICYVDGSGHGLALAMADISGSNKIDWNTATTSATTQTPAITGGTWKLASKSDWGKMIATAGNNAVTIRDSFSSVGGTNMKSATYWTSTDYENNSNSAYRVSTYSANEFFTSPKTLANFYARACLEF